MSAEEESEYDALEKLFQGLTGESAQKPKIKRIKKNMDILESKIKEEVSIKRVQLIGYSESKVQKFYRISETTANLYDTRKCEKDKWDLYSDYTTRAKLQKGDIVFNHPTILSAYNWIIRDGMIIALLVSKPHVFVDKNFTNEEGHAAFNDAVNLRAEKIKAKQKAEENLGEERAKEVLACALDFFDESLVDLTDKIENTGALPSTVKYQLTIKFPEFIIQNSETTIHKIHDFYLRIYFNKKFIKVGDHLYGARGKVTCKEALSAYGHSHKSDGLASMRKMCLGGADTPLGCLFSELYLAEYDIHIISCIFASLQNYVEWESLEGGPYNKIKNIRNLSSSRRPPSFHSEDVNLVVKTIYTNNLIPVLQLTTNNTLFYNPNDKTNIKLIDEVSHIRCLRSSDGKEFAIEGSNDMEKAKANVKAVQSFKFKDQTIKLELIEDEVKEEPLQKEENVVPKRLVELVYQQLTININNYFLKTTHYESE